MQPTEGSSLRSIEPAPTEPPVQNFKLKGGDDDDDDEWEDDDEDDDDEEQGEGNEEEEEEDDENEGEDDDEDEEESEDDEEEEDIFKAARRGDMELLEELLESGKAKVTDRDKYNFTPLHYAAGMEQTEACHCLLKHGADVNALGGSNLATPMQCATQHASGINIIRVLMAYNADINIRDIHGCHLLSDAVCNASWMVLLYLLQKMVKVDVRSGRKRTPLMSAASHCKAFVVDLLLEHGADPNARDKDGFSPLHYAAHGGDSDCIRKLVENGADLTAKTRKGRTAKAIARRSGNLDAWKDATEEKFSEDGQPHKPHINEGHFGNGTHAFPTAGMSGSFTASDVLDGAISHAREGLCPCCDDPTTKTIIDPDLPSGEKLIIMFMHITKDYEQFQGMWVKTDTEQIEVAILLGEVLLLGSYNEQALALQFSRSSARLLGFVDAMSLADIRSHKTVVRRLSMCYVLQYAYTQNLDDIDTAIALSRRCLEAKDEDVACDQARLCDQLSAKFERTSDLETINEAMAHGRASLQGEYQNHPVHLYELAMALHSRYTVYVREDDIDDSIALLRRSIEVALENIYPVDQQYLRHALAFVLWHRIPTMDEPAAFADECVDILRQLASEYPDERRYQDDLAKVFRLRYRMVSNDLSDLDEAIAICEGLLDDESVLRSDQFKFLHTLGEYLFERYKKTASIEDLDMSLDLMHVALNNFAKYGSHFAAEIKTNLATSHWERYLQRKNPEDLEASAKYISEVNDEGLVSSGVRLEFAINHSAPINHQEGRYEAAMLDYRTALKILPQHLMAGRNYRMGAPIVSGWDSVGAKAAAAGAACGRYGEALELLELGRAIGWNRGLQMRGELNRLEIDHPEHAQRFKLLSKSLEEMDLIQSIHPTSHVATEEVILGTAPREQHFNTSLQWSALLAEIRDLDGYKDFLSSPGYDQLKTVSKDGPVVVINISEYRSDAFILTQSTFDSPRLVPLPEGLHELTKQWADELLSGLRRVEDDPETEPIFSKLVLRPILSELWKLIVQPIRISLNCLDPYARRIWWIPTRWLTFLPLHLVTNGLDNNSDISPLIPSYSTTLSSLMRAKSALEQREPVSVLAVGCPSSDGFDEIPGTKKEIRAIAKIISTNRETRLDVLQESAATVQEVLSGMSEHTWLHLACHGIQSSDEPYSSYFALADGRIHMTEIVGARLKKAQFAFLSACQTATGIPTLSDESMHLAAGLHFAGFRGTIATMWSVHDKTAKKLSGDFYKILFHDPSAPPVVEDAAEALWRAIRKLRAEGVPLSRLAPFIHIGV